MIDIVKLNKAQLASFIESDKYKSMKTLPISRHRAISHINNPRALDDDILLILAYEESQMLGYLGILPDNKNDMHVGWLSCLWVSPLARGKGIAKKLVLTGYESYNKHILITNFTPEAESLYNRLGVFEELTTLKGMRYYRKMCLRKIIPHRYPKYSSFKWLFQITDVVFNLFWMPFLSSKEELKQVNINNIGDLTNEHISFISQYAKSNFNRNKAELDWIINFPWLLQMETLSSEAEKYHFSSEEKYFHTVLYEVRKGDELVAIIYLSNKNGHLRFPYILYKHNHEKLLATIISFLINKENPDYITLFEGVELLRQIRSPFVYKKQISRKYLKTKETELSGNINLYDGDGDAAFT